MYIYFISDEIISIITLLPPKDLNSCIYFKFYRQFFSFNCNKLFSWAGEISWAGMYIETESINIYFQNN